MKLILQELQVGQGSLEILNANFTAIATAFENTLSRNGTAPNHMTANIDLNGFRLYNGGLAAEDNEYVTLGQLKDMSTIVLYAPNPHTHTWAEVTGKPTTFTPSTHSHSTSDVGGLVSALSDLDTRLDAIEAEITVYVQASTPSSPPSNALWFW